jgi:16S rRNA (guanine966-N2)-methyltransferase
VEADRRAAECIRRNAETCGFADRVEVRCEPVEAALGRLPPGGFALAFLDPPYREGPAAALERLAPLLAPGATAVAEHDARRPGPERPPGLRRVDGRAWGGTGISIYRRG